MHLADVVIGAYPRAQQPLPVNPPNVDKNILNTHSRPRKVVSLGHSPLSPLGNACVVVISRPYFSAAITLQLRTSRTAEWRVTLT